MNKNSDNKDILYDIIGGFEDELIEKAADYKKSSKILSFPIYRYVNAVAAFLIYIISTVVFIQLKPIVEIDESLIIPTNQPTITATPKPTDVPVVTMVPVVESGDTETPSASIKPEKSPLATLRPMSTAEPAVTVVPTKKPAVVVVPTLKPVATMKPIIIIKPTKAPESTEVVVKTPESTEIPVRTDRPIITEAPVSTPEITKTPERTPEVTKVPVETPIATNTPDPDVTPTETVAPEPVPTETGSPSITNAPTPTAPVITDVPMLPTPEMTVEPTVTPPLGTFVPTVEPTSTPPFEYVPTDTPAPIETDTPEPSFTVEPTPKPTAPPLDIEDCTAVEGDEVIIKNLNGALYDEKNSIIEFTKESENNREGVEIVNPIAGNEKMIADYGYLMDVDTNGLLNAFHLSGSYLGWGTDREKLPIPQNQYIDGKPMFGNVDNRLNRKYADTDSVYYPKPENKIGFSISFWANNSRDNENGPAVTFLNGQQCVVVSINGNVDYVDIADKYNCFTADSDTYSKQGEWHYYTITFANDWITYYVDGVEVPYSNVELNSIYIRSFNDGFLTRYNSTLGWEKADFSNDWRCYLNVQRKAGTYTTLGNYIVISNSRYVGTNNAKRLLLSFMASEDTRVLLGGGELGYNHSIASYSQNVGTKYAQVKYYDVELTNKNVYANYHEALKSKPN